MTDDMFGPAKVDEIRQADIEQELAREIGVRKRVYPRWVAQGKLDGPLADHRILCLQAALKTIKNRPKE